MIRYEPDKLKKNDSGSWHNFIENVAFVVVYHTS